jgi:hypothetical protein
MFGAGRTLLEVDWLALFLGKLEIAGLGGTPVLGGKGTGEKALLLLGGTTLLGEEKAVLDVLGN